MFDIFNMLKKDEAKAVKQVTRETIIGDILDMDQSTAPYFMEIGMHCLAARLPRREHRGSLRGPRCGLRRAAGEAERSSGLQEVLSAADTGCASERCR